MIRFCLRRDVLVAIIFHLNVFEFNPRRWIPRCLTGPMVRMIAQVGDLLNPEVAGSDSRVADHNF